MSAATDNAWVDQLDATDVVDELGTLLDAITALARSRRRFSANDLPPHVRAVVNPMRVGRAFRKALDDGLIVKVALTGSDKKCTHGKPVWMYEAAPLPSVEQPRDPDGRWTQIHKPMDQLSIDEVLS